MILADEFSSVDTTNFRTNFHVKRRNANLTTLGNLTFVTKSVTHVAIVSSQTWGGEGACLPENGDISSFSNFLQNAHKINNIYYKNPHENLT